MGSYLMRKITQMNYEIVVIFKTKFKIPVKQSMLFGYKKGTQNPSEKYYATAIEET